MVANAFEVSLSIGFCKADLEEDYSVSPRNLW
jgi:hypothetical protein